jgi:hypothetical protein
MAQILDPLPNDPGKSLLCCYVNATNHIQIARITNIPNWYFERVVFPGQRLVFEAMAEAQLEIHSGMMASSILSDTIPCDRLSINDFGDEVTTEKHNGHGAPTEPALATEILLPTQSLFADGLDSEIGGLESQVNLQMIGV